MREIEVDKELEQFCWTQEKEAIETFHETDLLPPFPKEFQTYPLTGKKFQLGINNNPHCIWFYRFPILLWENVTYGWWEKGLGLKWADTSTIRKVVYHPNFTKYFLNNSWLDIEETLFVPEDCEAGIVVLNLKNNSSEKREIHLFLEATLHLSYYHHFSTPGTSAWPTLWRYDFANIKPSDVIDPGLDTCNYEDGIIVGQDVAKKEWNAAIGASIKPTNNYLFYYDKALIRNGNFINKGINKGIATERPRCCLQYNLSLMANTSKKLAIVGAGSLKSVDEALSTFNDCVENFGDYLEDKKKLYKRIILDKCFAKTPDNTLDKIFASSKSFVEELKYDTPNIGEGYLNSFPCYWEYFGRDVAVALRGFIDVGDFEGVKKQLEMYLKFQLPDGEIFHELIYTGVVGWWDADSTLLFVIAVYHYLCWSGDIEFVRKIYTGFKKTVEFLFKMDIDNNLLINQRGELSCAGTYPSRMGAEHIVDQIYFIKALEGSAEIATILGDEKNFKKWSSAAKEVKEKVEKLYWSNEHSFYGKEPNIFDEQSLSIWIAMGLLYKVLDKNRCKKVMDVYESDEFANDRGILLVSRKRKDFYPGHSVVWFWPATLSNAVEFMYHCTERGTMHLLNYASLAKVGLPGTTCDGILSEGEKQFGNRLLAFNVGGLLVSVIEGLFGIEPNLIKNELLVSPHIPYDWESCCLRDVRIGDCSFDVEFTRGEEQAQLSLKIESKKELRLKLGMNLPISVVVKEVLLNGSSIAKEANLEKTWNDVHVFSPQLKTKGTKQYDFVVKYELLAPYFLSSSPEIIDPALNKEITDFTELQYVNSAVSDGKIETNFYAPGGMKYRVRFKALTAVNKVSVNKKEVEFTYDKEKKTVSVGLETPKPYSLPTKWKAKEEVPLFSIDNKWQYSKVVSWDRPNKEAEKQMEWEEVVIKGEKKIGSRKYFPLSCYKKSIRIPDWREGRIFLCFKWIFSRGPLNIYLNKEEIFGETNKNKEAVLSSYRFGDDVNAFETRVNDLMIDITEQVMPGKEYLLTLKGAPIDGIENIFESCYLFQGWSQYDCSDNDWYQLEETKALELTKSKFIWMRNTLEIPSDFRNKKLRIKIYPDNNKSRITTGKFWIFINGKCINGAEGVNLEIEKAMVHNVFQAYINDYIDYDKENIIAIRVEGRDRAGILGKVKILPIFPINVQVEA